MTTPRVSLAQPQPQPPPRRGREPRFPGWAVTLLVVFGVIAGIITAHCFGVEAGDIAKVLYAVAALVTALGIGAIARNRRGGPRGRRRK